MSELVKSLMEIQRDLKAPKGQYNSFGKYKYRSGEDILEAVKPMNAEKGLLLTLSDEPTLIGDWHYIKATATITNGKETHTVTAYARESLNKKGMDDSQITGTASSYARKYALNGLYLIDDTKDADTDEYQNQSKGSNQKASTKTNGITTAQRQLIASKTKMLGDKLGIQQMDVYKAAQTKLGIEKPTSKLTSEEAAKVIEYLISQE